MKFQPVQIGAFANRPPEDQISILLKEAVAALAVKNSESACWRMADAGLLMQRRLNLRGARGVQGFDQPTNRGAMIGGAK